VDEFEQIRMALNAIERELHRAHQRLDRQSHTIRELAKYLSEHGISISRFTTTTQETLVAVALNGDY